jgi:hypothetical protein
VRVERDDLHLRSRVFGQQRHHNWFASPFIVKLSIVTALALVGFVLWQFITPRPLVNLRLLGRRNFGLGTLSNFMIGFALYGSAYLLPQYLAVAQGFDAEQIGEVVAWTGLPQFLLMPLVPLLMKRIDSRLLVGVGLLVFAASCFMNLWLDGDYAAPQLFWSDVIRAVGQAIVMTPISAIAMLRIAPKDAGAASGLFNMMRNLGAAIGTAVVETFFTHREQFHSAMITPKVSLLEPATRDRLADLQRYFMAHGYPEPMGAMHRTIIAVGQTIRAQATDHGIRRQLCAHRGCACDRGPGRGAVAQGRGQWWRGSLGRSSRTLTSRQPIFSISGADAITRLEPVAPASMAPDTAGSRSELCSPRSMGCRMIGPSG